MYAIEIVTPKGTLRYTYWVGVYTVGIITGSRKKFLRRIDEVSGRPENSRTGVENGMADCRLTPEEVASYMLRNKFI